MTYGFDAETLVVWIDSFDRVATDRAGVLCRRHADAMVVPLGWMLDDRRDPVPRLFKAPVPMTPAPRQRRSHAHQHNDAEQLEFDAEEAAEEGEAAEAVDDADTAAATVRPAETEVTPWKPTFDQTDDLDGLLEAHSPLLARAFGGSERRRPSR